MINLHVCRFASLIYIAQFTAFCDSTLPDIRPVPMHGTTGRAMDLSSQGLSPRKIDVEKKFQAPYLTSIAMAEVKHDRLEVPKKLQNQQNVCALIHRDDLFVFLTIQFKQKTKTKQNKIVKS